MRRARLSIAPNKNSPKTYRWLVPVISLVLLASVCSALLVIVESTARTAAIRAEAEKVVLVVDIAESIQDEADSIAQFVATTEPPGDDAPHHVHETASQEPSSESAIVDQLSSADGHHSGLGRGAAAFEQATSELSALISGEQRSALQHLVALHDSYLTSFEELDALSHEGGGRMDAYHADTQVVEAELRRALRAFERSTTERLQDAIVDVRRNEVIMQAALPLISLAGITALLLLVRIARSRRQVLESLVIAKDNFLGSVSHELRTPLTVILGFAELLRAGSESMSPDHRKELVTHIAEQSKEVSALVEDLLVAARVEIGQLSVAKVRVDLRAQIAQVSESLFMSDSVEVKASPSPVVVVGDPIRVRQIVRNLLTNARRYGSGRISVVLDCADTDGVAEVHSYGPPITAEHRELIFEPYHRAHDDRGLAGSIGLGLSVARELARLMDGDLTYERRGQRNVFVLTLPLLDESRSHPASHLVAAN